MKSDEKIILAGGAGLVGHNLAICLVNKGYRNITILDKHRVNAAVLKELQPQVTAISADLAEPGEWQDHFENAEVIVMLQAQIGGSNYNEFVRNNIDSTKLVLDTMKSYDVPYLVHISSSVVESVAEDFYTDTKKIQERLVLESGLPCSILRPTLMFGLFDRKHLGWLSRFMKKIPVFPIPGDGRYMRQPLYAGDFCNIIVSCIENQIQGGIYNISGQEKIGYIDVIREIRRVVDSKTIVVCIPKWIFYILLFVWGLFDRDPPFTTQQLTALTAGDEFEVIDWPSIFDIPYTPFKRAIEETFTGSDFSRETLEF